MSAISTILARLRAAIWAIDVRDDIANAIEQCYSDVSNPTLKTEALEAALQTKIDAGEMAALTIGDGTITGAKLANGTIPKAKLDPSITFDADPALDTTSTNAIQNKVVAGAISTLQTDLDALDNKVLNDNIKVALLNCISHIGTCSDPHAEDYYNALHDALYPSYGVFLGKALNPSTGKYYETATRVASDFIRIDGQAFSAEISNQNMYISFRGYDENKDYLGNITGNSIGTMGTSAVSGEWNASVKYVIMVAKKSDNSAFTNSDMTGVSLTINGIEKSLSVKSFYAMNLGKGISPTTGETYDASNRMCSDYISVSSTSFTAEISNPNIYIGFRAYGTGFSYITPAESIGTMQTSSVSGTWSSAVKLVRLIAKKSDDSPFTQADLDGFTLTVNGETRAMQ